ncbi:MAG: peptidase domain-containing ABC transporter [Chitinophagaceae bacterium]|jgi:ATP-binding cassette subfamily B protein|nr:peptidase domain-containing ABC transporter [Chitinophagaceae bacterium]MCA6498212.1 peptidase domain-containing ABC transporter [Chitinophagaceae bacterium]MCA6512902.1 peptidase domain-containing ABC transporter [Chitinophagaceae bacterium]
MNRLGKFTSYIQMDQMDCGPTCLRMIAKYYGKHYSLETLRNNSFLTREGSSLKGISEAAEKIGFRPIAAKLTFEQLDEDGTLPCILHWNQNHYVVLPPQNYNRKKANSKILIADPSVGLVNVTKETFLNSWLSESNNMGVALFLEPSPYFYDSDGEKSSFKRFSFLYKYLVPYKKFIWQLFLGMFIGSLLSLIAPFLTQSMVDYGINQQNVHFIYLILFSQLALFFGNTAIEVIRNWIILHMSTRVNVSIISDFLIKLMKLPIRFFDTKMIGDITQRINDHNRIENFLTGTSLNTIFSLVNLLVFSVVLGVYSLSILFVFFLGSCLSIVWILFFMRRRRELDYARFQQLSDNQNNLYEIITGMQDIKMNNSETSHRWGWERIQAKLFKINIKGLALSQYQTIGANFFSQLKNIIVSFISAKEVINGNISLGMLLSISYISGQMNSPINQIFSFFQTAQDAKISIERLSEIHSKDDEEHDNDIIPDHELNMITDDPNHKSAIILENVSFSYGSKDTPKVLNNINLKIPIGKTTAVVGASGSGKTTLMKLILKFYEPTEGTILLGSTSLNKISSKWWRSICGVVMSEGYIFSNTIARNISVNEQIDKSKLLLSAKLTNLEDFIGNLPNGFSTKIGNAGNGISSGQKQRVLIARAIYKNPAFLFLDEATSTLDANNEKKIIENLANFSSGKTVFVIAHRLSTVRHADQIVVMENGNIVEIGDHNTLASKRGKYFELIKNQLELGD